MKYRVTDTETEQVHEYDDQAGVEGFMRAMQKQGKSTAGFKVDGVPDASESAPAADAG